MVRSEVITVRTGDRPAVRDITRSAAEFVAGEADGLLHVFVPYATAGVALIETGSGSDEDLLRALDDLLPGDDRWRHRHGSRGHGRDHLLPAFVAPYVTVPVIGGRPAPRWPRRRPASAHRTGCRTGPVARSSRRGGRRRSRMSSSARRSRAAAGRPPRTRTAPRSPARPAGTTAAGAGSAGGP